MIKAIILDMGGVVFKSKVESVLENIANQLKIDSKEFINLYETHKPQLQMGEMKISELCELAKQKFGRDTNIFSIWKKAYWKVMLLNRGLLNLTKKLRKKYKVGLITNVSDLHFELTKKRMIYDKYFDACVISCEEGVRKPDKKIFEILLKKLNLEAEECIYIDDRLELLTTPSEMGFKTICYKTNNQLIEELKALGVSP